MPFKSHVVLTAISTVGTDAFASFNFADISHNQMVPIEQGEAS